MSATSQATGSADRAPIPFAEFVALVAAMIALNALGIDAMLPAFPAIGASLDVPQETQRQFIITVFLLGYALASLAFGPLTDRYGRRPIMVASMIGYALTNLLAAGSTSFAMLLAVRFVSGGMIAGVRTTSLAMVRDCFAARAMAKVMSLAFMVFMVVPVIAPSFGQAILLVAPWRWIFVVIAFVSLAVLGWYLARMPETLAPERRRAISAATLIDGARRVATDRYAVGYTLASTGLQGGLFGFLGSIQLIMAETFHRPNLLGVVFAGVASTMALGSFVNSRIVMQYGTRIISHSALVSFITFAGLHLLVVRSGYETLPSFVVLQALMMASFALAGSNFSAMAMENMGEIAGTAASLQAAVSTSCGALIGAGLGLLFDGTTEPLYAGFLALGLAALVIVAIAERGRLFVPHHTREERRAKAG